LEFVHEFLLPDSRFSIVRRALRRVAVERREFIAMLASTPGVSIPSAADAQGATAAAPKPLSITLLGTGTPSPSLERQSSGYLIEAGHDVIVWDHGPGAQCSMPSSRRRHGNWPTITSWPYSTANRPAAAGAR
jgi:hypothetical protein